MKVHAKGFTLIELMVVVAIVAILAAIAVPSYSSYVEKSRRMEARESLYRVVNAMEKFMLANNAYPATIDLLANGDATRTPVSGHGLTQIGGNWVTADGHYVVTIPDDVATAGWRVRATARSSSPQIKDETCRTFQLFLDGRQSAFSAANENKTAECWPG